MDRHRPYRPAPALQSVLDEINLVGNPLDRMTAENVGALWTLREVLAANVLGPVPVGGVRDVGIPARNRQIPARVYLPPGPELARDGRLPALVYYHGGGWTLGSIATYDSLCRGLARGSGALVVSIDYRLAPEHPFPAAVDDAHLALWWVARNADDLGADVRRLAVGGDSAGGNLASVVAMRAAKEGLPVAFQLQLYPATDLTRTDRPSHEQYGRDHLLTARAIEALSGGVAAAGRGRRLPTPPAGGGDDGGLRPAARRGGSLRPSPGLPGRARGVPARAGADARLPEPVQQRAVPRRRPPRRAGDGRPRRVCRPRTGQRLIGKTSGAAKLGRGGAWP